MLRFIINLFSFKKPIPNEPFEAQECLDLCRKAVEQRIIDMKIDDALNPPIKELRGKN